MSLIDTQKSKVGSLAKKQKTKTKQNKIKTKQNKQKQKQTNNQTNKTKQKQPVNVVDTKLTLANLALIRKKLFSRQKILL